MRYTQENPQILSVPKDELWVGVVESDEGPVVALVTRSKEDDDVVLISAFSASEARLIAAELISLAGQVDAPNK